MTKLSKKLLALIMAMAMVITMLPLNAFTALASGNTSVKQYLVDSIDSAFTVGNGVSWDAGENAAYFDGSTTGFLTLGSNPLSGVTTSSGFAISFDVKRYDNTYSMSRILDINDGTSTNTFAINGGIDGTNGEKYIVLDKFGGAETRYAPTTFQSEEKQGVWYTYTVVFDTDNSIKFYVDGTLKDTATDTKNTLSNIGSLTSTLVGASIYGTAGNDANFKGYIRNLTFFDDLYDLDYARASYEAVMSKGLVYNRMSNAYDKYVYTQKKLDAAAYGSTAFTDAEKKAAAKDLIIATANMGEWKMLGRSYKRLFANDSVDYPAAYNNLVYAQSGYSNTSRGSQSSGSEPTVIKELYYPEVTMLYDGTSNAPTTAMILHVYSNNSTKKDRYATTGFSNMSNATLQLERWRGNIGDNYDATWGISSGTTYFNAASTESGYSSSYVFRTVSKGGTFSSNTFYHGRFGNYIKYTGTMSDSTAYDTITPSIKVYCNSSNGWNPSDGLSGTVTGNVNIYVINYARLINAVNTYKTTIDSITNYKEGGAADFLNAYDALTGLNPMSYFTSSNDWNGCQTAITNAINGMSGHTTVTADQYNGLKAVMDESGTPAEGTYRALRDAYTGAANTWGYDATTYAAFKAEYERAVAAFDDVLTNGYTGSYGGKTVAAIATDLDTKFLALDGSAGAAPTVSGNALLSATDTVTITNNEANTDDGKVYYTVSYDTGASKSGELTLANGASDTIAPFSFTEAEGASTALVTAHVIVDGNNSPAGSLNVTLYKYPTGTPTVLQKAETITLTSQNGANAGTIMYSYDQQTWEAYSAPFAPFANSGAATRTIYVKEIGTGVESVVGTISVARAASLAAYADPTPDLGADYYNGESAIKLATDTTYDTGSIRYKVQKASDSDFGAEQTYDESTGFAGSAYDDESFIVIKAYAAGNEDNAQITTLYNEELYNPLAYQESFNNVTVTNGSSADVLQSGTGYNMTSAGNTISVVSGAGTYMSGSTSESHSWRNNVLKINANSTAPGPVVTLNKNPLNQAINAAAVRKNGVTISFWRHMERNGSTADLDTTTYNNTGYNWRNAIAFQKENDNSIYYIVEVNGVNSRRVDGSNYLDVVPENQDNTQHEMGAANGEWEHVAITINPNSGIKVYLNGVEHDYKYATGVGSFVDGNTAAAAQEILAFLSDGTTQMTLDNGVMYEGNDYDLFLDDIRLYTKPLTQVEINNMYVDEYTDTVTSTTSTSHDPTSVTVYTLTNGKKVGVEYIEKNNISDSEIAAIDYYSFGTGMTIYHATDNTQTKWEVLGDSMGRCGYQNQDLFYKNGEPAVYTDALADVVTAAAFDADEISQGAGHLVWAPHVMYNLERDCWVYYASMSYWGGTHSATFMATSSDPIRGYTYNSIVYQSKNHTPNSIDFAAFYNADYTKLYFVMGSWNWNWKTGESGDNCIYGMELNIDGTAKYPDLDSMYTNGTMIASCYRTSYEGGGESDGAGEGAFVQYIDGYYYLFVSYGTNAGSYTERVFRSTEPLGTYVGYNGISSTSTSTGHHGNQILAPFDIALYDNVFRSTGHNSLYKVKNNNGEWVYVNAVHGRPYASDSHEWKAVPDNALAKRQSGDVTGNVTLNNMVAVNEDGWLVMFPNQYNGTDSYSTHLTAKQIEGIYTASDMRLQVDSNWGKEYTYTMLADEAYTDRGIAFGVKDGITFTSKFYLNYDENKKVQYITIYTSADVDPETATADQIRYKGVVGTHTGKDKYGNDKLIPMLGMINEYNGSEYPHTLYIGEHSWAYRSGDVPDAADVVSDVDAVALDGVIYTHADDATEAQVASNHGTTAEAVAKSSYALYGQEIADNFQYGTGTTNAERYTTLTVAYPYKIDLSNASAIYCYSDGERCRTGGYTGSLITAVPLNKNTTVGGFDILESGGRYTDTNQLWYDKSTGTAYTQAQVDAMSDSDIEALNLVRYYGFRGTVSDYFKYDETNGEYTEDGVELIVSYINIETNEQKQEFEFCYVMPNPGWAHTIAGVSNNNTDLGNDRNSSMGTFNRFVDSWGTATGIYSSMLWDPFAKYSNKTDSASGYGHGVSGYLSDFEDHTFGDNDLDSIDEINQLMVFTDADEGVNSGSFSCWYHNKDNPNAYAVAPDVIDTNYYVDYSDKQLYDIDGGSGLITTAANGVPTGYTFKMETNNFLWNKISASSIFDLTSYQMNTTKQKGTNQPLSITYSSSYDSEVSNYAESSTTGYTTPTHLINLSPIIGTNNASSFNTSGIMQTNLPYFNSQNLTSLSKRRWYNDSFLYHIDLRDSNAHISASYRNKVLYFFSDRDINNMQYLKKDSYGGGSYIDGTDNSGTPSKVWKYWDVGNEAYKTLDNGKGSTHSWHGEATFTGKYSVIPAEQGTHYYDGYWYDSGSRRYWTADEATAAQYDNYGQFEVTAENYANYILEMGSYHKVTDEGSRGGRYLGKENYHYYNIGVHTCDKGAMRQFAEEVLNQDIDLEQYAEDGTIVTTGPIDSSKVSYASYKDYIRAVAKCMWFAENPKNTTAGDLKGQEQYANDYAERESDDMEYRTAYDAEGHAIYNTETAGSNIFQDGTTTTDPVQAQLIKDVIEAYANLYDVTKYAEVESEYKKTKEFFENAQDENEAYRQAQIDAGVAEEEVKDLYSEQSITNYENALDAIKNHAVNYFIYWDEGPNKDTVTEEDGKYHVVDKDGNPVIDPETGEQKTIDIIDTALDDEEFWRKSALSGEEYEELKDFMRELRGSLVEPVDETPLTSQINNAVVPTFDANGTPVYDNNGDIVTVEADASKKEQDETGIFNNEGTQIYSYASWKALDDCLYDTTAEYDEYEEDLSKTHAEMATTRDASAATLAEGTGANDLVNDTKGSNKYATLGERNLKDLLNTVEDVKYEIQLDASDANSPYRSRDQLAVDKKAAELAPLVLKDVDSESAYNAYNTAFAVASAIDFDRYTDDALAEGSDLFQVQIEMAKRQPEVYIAVTQDMADTYNSRVGNDKTHLEDGAENMYGEVRVLGTGETDPYTAALLTWMNYLEGFVKQFKATMTVTKTNAAGQTTTATLPAQTVNYGEFFNFDLSSYLTEATDPETGESTGKLNEAVTYSVTTMDGLAADFDSAEATGSKKWTYKGTELSRLADSNMAISATIVEDKSSTNDIPVKFYNLYNRLVDTVYVADASKLATNGASVTYDGTEIYKADAVPFYSFTGYKTEEVKDGETVTGLKYTAQYSALPQVTFTVPAIASITATTADFDSEVTLSQKSTIEGFKAWMIKTGNKYAVASYNPSYTFYAVADSEFAVLTKSGDVYTITKADGTTVDLTDDNSIAANIAGTVGEFETNTGTTNYPYGALKFFDDKIENQLPFIAVLKFKQDATDGVEENGKTKYTHVLYALITDGTPEAKLNNVSVVFTKNSSPYTAKVSNLSEHGQFVVSLKVSSKTGYNASGVVNYKFSYSYNEQTVTINAKDTTDPFALQAAQA